MATKSSIKTRTVRRKKEESSNNVIRTSLPDWVHSELCKGCVIQSSSIQLAHNPNFPEYDRFAYVAAILDHGELVSYDESTGKTKIEETLSLQLSSIEPDIDIMLKPFVLTPELAKKIKVADTSVDKSGSYGLGRKFLQSYVLKHYSAVMQDMSAALDQLNVSKYRLITLKSIGSSVGLKI